ncbi:HAD family hydrolase [Stackebrandtia sp.]|uniref:HAD family hydrolase n=1 Tax=Stackebrandtia sp. TaxID=2023065 RepID=UPI0032C2369D
MSKHLVWDWNGTLLDDFSVIVEATNVAMRTVDGEILQPDVHRRRFRRPIIDFYSELVGRPLSADEFSLLDKAFHDHYHSLMRSCPLTADARDAIATWGGTQSLLSMWFHSELVPLVQEHGLTESFSRIDGLRVRDESDSKYSYLVAHLAALGVEPGDAVMIGDSVDDFVAADRAGASIVLYGRGFSDPRNLRATGAPVADSLAEAVRIARAG